MYRFPGNKIWQRNYYEHVVRDVESIMNIKVYIRDNPSGGVSFV